MIDQEEAHTYKVGDRVRLVWPAYGLPANVTGKITGISGPEWQQPITVDWDVPIGGRNKFMEIWEIEPA